MAQDIVQRWKPSDKLSERPADIFDTNWQGGQQRLIVSIKYADDLGETNDDALIIFHDVFAHRVFDEDMDDVGLLGTPAAQLAIQYPYGGRWPFLEVESSTWIDELMARHCVWKAVDFRHLIVTARNMHLHVACRNLMSPSYIAGDG